jgi:hypothetical protein
MHPLYFQSWWIRAWIESDLEVLEEADAPQESGDGEVFCKGSMDVQNGVADIELYRMYPHILFSANAVAFLQPPRLHFQADGGGDGLRKNAIRCP